MNGAKIMCGMKYNFYLTTKIKILDLACGTGKNIIDLRS